MRAIYKLLSVPESRRNEGWLRDSLQEALEIEFSTIPPYLYAMWSLDGSPSNHFVRDEFGGIVREGMLHMGLVANLLAAIGGRPLFVNTAERGDVVPVYPGPIKAGVHAGLTVHLAPISPALLLNAFMVIEEPDTIPEGAAGPGFLPTGEKTIGAFYSGIAQAIRDNQAALPFDLAKQLDMTILDPRGQKIATAAEAVSAIDLILRQGEGADQMPFDQGPDDLAHFYRFAQMAYGKLLQGNGPFAYEGDPVVFTPRLDVPADPIAESPEFDQSYSRMLDGLQRAWDTASDEALSETIYPGMMSLTGDAHTLMEQHQGPRFRYIPAAAPLAESIALAFANAPPQPPVYSMVRQALDRAVNGSNFGAHGAFWRTLTRDQFVMKKIFGKQLVAVGDAANSNLVRALRGTLPFGSDTGTAGASLRRMPAARPPMEEADIALIEQWIQAGCPDDPPAPPAPVRLSFTTGAHVTPDRHNAYWRDFDNWAMFNASDEIQDAIGVVLGLFDVWKLYARDARREPEWVAAVQAPDVKAAASLLSTRQREPVETHYGSPAPLLALLDSYQRFGAGTLPSDPLRPVDPNHQMNGASMWFVWMAYVEAAVRLNVDPEFWLFLLRAILCGMMSDGLERGRFVVAGFSPGSSLEVFTFVQALPDAELLAEARRRYVKSGL